MCMGMINIQTNDWLWVCGPLKRTENPANEDRDNDDDDDDNNGSSNGDSIPNH